MSKIVQNDDGSYRDKTFEELAAEADEQALEVPGDGTQVEGDELTGDGSGDALPPAPDGGTTTETGTDAPPPAGTSKTKAK